MRHIGLLILLVIAKSSSAEPVGDIVPIEDGIHADGKLGESNFGFAPIVAYTPTYKFIVGAAGFVFPKSGRLGLDTHLLAASALESGKFNVSFARQNDWNDRWGYTLDATYTNFFTNYFGEGDDTPTKAVEYEQRFYRVHEGLRYRFSPEDSVESFVETRSRTDLGLKNHPDQHLVPDETRSVAGFSFTHDTRDSLVNTHQGNFALAQVQSSISTGSTRGFAQLELEYRHFFPLPHRMVLGLRSEFSTTTGTPSYDYAYNLGGIERLRGFFHNRFRGSQYYLAGGECRKDIYKDYLQIVTFADGGDIRDESYLRPRFAYGFGVRIGLPPDWDMKFRIDYAQSDDQHGVFATFGQAF